MPVDVQASARGMQREAAAIRPSGFACVLLFGLAYGLVHSALRLAVSHNLAVDDIKSNLYTQTLELGYVDKQPPLYEWMLWGVQQFTGPTLPSFLILKYGLLTATLALLYLVAKRLFADERWAVLAGLSPLMLYQIAWNLHEGVTQTMALICAVAATMWAFMRLAEHGRASDYLLFGLTAGLGLLTKYNFAAFLFILLACASLQPVLRARLLDRRFLLSLGMSGAVVAPVVYWFVTQGHDLVALYRSSIAPMAEKNWLAARAIGLAKTAWAPFGFLFPLIVIVLCFPGMLREALASVRAGLKPRHWERAERDWRLLLLHMTLGGFIVLAFGALATGATHYLERYMHPFFLLTPLWLLTLVERTGPSGRRLGILTAILAGATLLVVPVRTYGLLETLAGHCRKCRIAVPYETLVAALRERGFQSGTIIAATREDAGNLRRFFPAARIVRLERPRYAPPPRAAQKHDKLAVVWREGYRLPKEAKREYAGIVRELGQIPERVNVPEEDVASRRGFAWTIIVTEQPSP